MASVEDTEKEQAVYTMSDWQLHMLPSGDWILHGFVFGHPRFPDGSEIGTSPCTI